jgi:very-short-patch-repair endonuclease
MILKDGRKFLGYREMVRKQPVSSIKIAMARSLRKQMTLAEKLLWESLRDRRLDGHKFRRQQIISGFITDFYCNEVMLSVEVDGPIHECSIKEDKERDNIFRKASITVLRFKNDEVLKDIESVLTSIRLTIFDLLNRLPAPPSHRQEKGDGGMRYGETCCQSR